MPKKHTSPKTRQFLSEAQAERSTKAAAKKRRITIELTDEQYKKLATQYRKLNPAEATELVFMVGTEIASKLKVAGYSYTGDTCCA